MIPETSDMCPKSNTLSPTPSEKSFTGSGCKIGGCSGEICQNTSDESITTICIYKADYACYKTARCEVQANGKCGWTQTSELTSCLSNSK
jgi:eight-cysteine-cluster-containing protein